MKAHKSTAWLSAIALLGGCTTTLGVRHAPIGGSSAGIPAVLPFTRYEITVTWRLARCGGDPKVVLGVEANAGSEDDPDQSYLIDPNSLQGPLNTSQFNVTYHDDSGTLRTVNAEVEDRSAAIIGNIVRTAVALAPAAMGVPSLATLSSRTPSREAPERRVSCTQAMEDALSLVGDLEGRLETMNGQVATATAEVAVLAAAAVRMGGAIDPVTSQRYGDALDNLDRLVAAQAGLAGELAEALKPLTSKRVVRWPDSGSDRVRAQPVALDPSVLTRWFVTTPAGATATTPNEWPQAFFRIEPVVAQRLPIEPDVAQRRRGQRAAPSRGSAQVAGIPYRLLVRGRLIMCTQLCGAGVEGRTVVEGPIAQLGGVNVLPVRNPPFGSTSFSAEFRRDGSLVSAGYAQRTAPLESATGALAGAAEALGPLLDPTARLNHETAYLQALQQRRDAAEALQPAQADATAEARDALAAETTLLNAQIANLQARLTLQELRARTETH